MTIRVSLIGAVMAVGVGLASFQARSDVVIAFPLPKTGERDHSLAAKLLIRAEATAKAIEGTGAGPFKLIQFDDRCDAKQAVEVASLVVSKGIKFVIGHPCPEAALAASHVYEREGALMITGNTSLPDLTGRGLITIFRLGDSDAQHGEVGAKFILERLKQTRIAVLHDRQPYGVTLATRAHLTLRRAGVEPILVGSIADGSEGIKEAIAQIKRRRVQVVYFGGNHEDLAKIVIQARQAGSETIFISGGSARSVNFWRSAGKYSDGTLFTYSSGEISANNDPANDPSKLHNETGLEKEYYSALQVVVSAIARVGPAPDSVAAIMRTASFDTAMGRLQFDASGNLRSQRIAVYEWTDGRYAPSQR